MMLVAFVAMLCAARNSQPKWMDKCFDTTPVCDESSGSAKKCCKSACKALDTTKDEKKTCKRCCKRGGREKYNWKKECQKIKEDECMDEYAQKLCEKCEQKKCFAETCETNC